MNPSRCPCCLSPGGAVVRRLAVLAVTLAFAVTWVWAQQPAAPTKAPAPAKAETAPKAPAIEITPSSPAALALDRRIIEEGKNNPQVIPNLTYLCDVIGPRLTGSPALKKANDWTAQKMEEYGLSNVHLEPWTIPVGWQRGTATVRMIEPDNGHTLTVAAGGWSGSTKGKIEGDVVVLKAGNTKELQAYKGKLKNAIVLQRPPSQIRPITDTKMLLPGAFPGRRKGGEAPKAGDAPKAGGPPKDGDTRKEARKGADTPKAGDPSKAGAAPERRFGRGDFGGFGAFQAEVSAFLRTEGAAVILTDAGKPHGLLNMSGGWRSRERADAAEPLPLLYTAHEDYAMLYRLATRPEPAKTRVAVEVNNQLISGPVPVYNTVGEIRGKDKPDEFVVLGAHLDSWDLGTGATDNGTGSMVVLEAARILSSAKIQPRRTIRFVLFTGEEQGLHGSRAYVEKHKDELPRISMCLVHDTGTGKVEGIGLQGRKALLPLMRSELASLKELGVGEINEGSMGGTDHLSFDRVGVPGFACRQDPAEYRFTHHSQSDTLDKAREPDLIQGAQVMAVTALRVANLDLMLPRGKQIAE